MNYVTIALAVVNIILGLLLWKQNRRANNLAAKLAKIEIERHARQMAQENSLLAADLEIYRASFGNLKVINNGPGSATSVSVKFASEPDARLVGGSPSGAMSLTDLKPGEQTPIVISSRSVGDDRIKFTLYWEEPRGPHTKEIDCLFGELPANPSQRRGISRPAKHAPGGALRPQPRKPHGI